MLATIRIQFTGNLIFYLETIERNTIIIIEGNPLDQNITPAPKLKIKMAK